MAGYQPRVGTDHVWFNGTDVHDWSVSTQLGVRVTEMRGWDERPDVRDVRELRSGQDGEYADNLYLGGRTITISGEVYGSSWVDLQARKRALAAVFTPTSSEVLLKVPDPSTASPTVVYATTGMTGYERASVRVIEPLTFGDMIGSFGMRWQVSLRASDPRVYSDVETTSTSAQTGSAVRTVTVDQTGTYETPAVITATGPITSPVLISATNDTSLSINWNLAASDQIVIDTRDRTVDLSAGYLSARTAVSTLQALWPLNETSGTTADNLEGTSARDATYTGGFTLNQAGPLAGLSSVALNGTTGYISVPNVAELYPDGPGFECWVKFDVLGVAQTIVDGITSNKGFRIEIDSSNRIVAASGSGSATRVVATSPTTALATGTWYRVLGYADTLGFGVKFYSLTGAVIGTSTTYVTSPPLTISYLPATSGGYRLGSRLGGTQFLDGNLSSCAIYDYDGPILADLYALPSGATGSVSLYSYLDAPSAAWKMLGTDSTTFSLPSAGLTTASSLSVKHRPARL